MIKAIYKAREDGDYDFVAAFAEEHDYDEHPAYTYAKEIEAVCVEEHRARAADVSLEGLVAEGKDEVILHDFEDLTHLVDVLTGEALGVKE